MPIGSYHFIVAMVAAWLSREQEAVVDYVKQENRVHSVQLGGKRLRFTDGHRDAWRARASSSAAGAYVISAAS